MIHTRSFIPSFALLFLALLFAFCKYAAKKDQTATNPSPSIKDKTKTEMPMPPLPLAGDYAADWKIVDSLEKQGLFKSALEKVEGIQTRAHKDRNSPQAIKALLYRGKYTTMLEEDGFVKAVQLFETDEKTAEPAEKAVLQSILGQLYATYLQNQAWKIQSRTPIPDGEGGDILTWSAAQMERQALDMYRASVERRPMVLETSVDAFRDILTPSQNDTVAGRLLRPTLYDLLAHRALAFFANERSYLTEPAYKFEINNPEAFAPLDQFLKVNFETKDSTSGKWLALKTFQQVLSPTNRERAKNTAALIDADLLRLQFVRNNYIGENKDELYIRALESLHKQYYDEPSAAEIAYQMAVYWFNLATGDKGSQAKQAVTICEDAIRRHPGTYGAQQCSNLLEDMRSRVLNMQTEEAYLPEKPMLVALSLRNLSDVWVKVVRVPNDPDSWNNIPYEQRLNYLNGLQGLQNRTWKIPDPADYQLHRTEIALEPLPTGNYWVLVSSNINFDPQKGPVAFSNFSCSNLSAVQYDQEGTTHFVLANRLSGAPVPGTTLEFFSRDNQNSNRNRLTGTATTDANGLAVFNLQKNTYASVRASLANDTLWIGQAQNYRYGQPEAPGRQVQFFTDRALYRPGQLVYFKGILFKAKTDGQPQIIPNQAVTVKFLDANQQEKGQLKLRSNEFGTFNGAFTAPSSGLTGQMSIMLTEASGQANFNVEEYKRPKFEVTFKPVEGAFRLDEMVTIRGEAKAYAGSNVDGAQVHYRVVRQARFPFYDFGWGRKMFPPWRTDEMEITNGNLTTDANGGFEIKFTAIPDRSIPKKEQPVFDYTIYADVTDINGETRSSQQWVSVAYIGLKVDLSLDNEVEMDSLHKVRINTTNLAGQFQAASGEVTLQRLVEPKTFYINRYWERPDLMTIPKANFVQMFPDYAWKDEDDPEKWDRQDMLIPFSFNTANSKTVDLHGGKVQPGYYYLHLKTKDAFGQDVEIKRVIRVWDKNNRATQFVEPAAKADKTTLEPGETAHIWLGGKPAPLNFFFARERDGKLDNPRWVSVNGANSVDLPITDADRGGVPISFFTIKNNRVYIASVPLNVPWSDKELNITYETFRDKLAPGQQEEWRIKISGPKKEKVAAEMVAAMYDASLDQFLPHSWEQIYFPAHYAQIGFNARTFGQNNGDVRYEPTNMTDYPSRVYHDLDWFDFPLYGGNYYRSRAMADGKVTMEAQSTAPMSVGGAPMQKEEMSDTAVGSGRGQATNSVSVTAPASRPAPPPPPPSPIRTNLQETVFFFPELRTDAQGNVIVKFKMNEALTRWKFMAFAHTKDLQQAVSMKDVVTQKELMVLANAPRFLREGDEMEFSAKVSNLSQEALTGVATLSLLDANTLQPVEADFGIAGAGRTANFTVQPGQSAPLAWKIKVPAGKVNGLTWQIFADGKKFRDGEESTIPVVTNRMLVTETLPITVRGNQTKSFTFDNIRNNPSNTLTTQRYTLEFTSNPVWYAVQSLPYLMEFPHECSEQIFSRFYANTLASSVTQRLPNIRKVYDRWKGTGAMKSNLAKNQELKTALLEETPWVLDAQSEEQQKQNIALLFDLNRMADEQERALNILTERQLGDGSWPWFPGGRGDWYITQYMVEGFGHLQQLGAFDAKKDQKSQSMLDKALGFCDAKMVEQYRELEKQVKAGKAKWEDDHLDGLTIHYLYTKSFFKIDRPGKEYAYYLDQAGKYWLGKGLYQEGLLALALHRAARPEAAAKIVASLRERATQKEELGMYWPNDWGYYWYQLPVETQALMVEVFSEVAKDPKAVEELRIWLLKNKQTNNWESTKATAEAVYALLLGTGQPTAANWLNNTKTVQVSLGGKGLKPNEIEPGTGYFKQAWNGSEVKKSWSEIKVENPNSNIVWGAAYWQYFEDLDKIKSFKKTPLTIVKQLYKVADSPTGPVLTQLAEGAKLKPGDRLKVRIEIRVDRAMEYVHLKDMRAAGFEPTNVLSQYKWQGGLGYYESTKDLATHFFIDYLPKGTFVFEYPLVVSHRGDMSNGITTMQCMYAPEFTSHSMGIRVKVE